MSFRSSSVLASTTAVNAAVPVPAGAAINDIALVALYLESTTTVTPPAGFTLKTSLATTAATRGRIDVFWKRLTAADAGTWSFTHASAYRGAVAGLWSGRATSGDPFDVAPGTIEGSANATTSVNPGCTTVTSACDLVGFASNFAAGTGSWTAPSGMTAQQSGNTTEIAEFTIDAVASGATGTKTFTYSVSGIMKSFLGALTAGGVTTVNTTDSNTVAGVSSSVESLSRTDAAAVSDTDTTLAATAPVDSATTVDVSTVVITLGSTDAGTVADASSSISALASTENATLSESSTGAGGAVAYNGYGSADPGITFGADSNEGVFSVAFQTSLAGQIVTGARIFVPAGATGDLTGAYGYLFALDPAATGYPVGPALATSALTTLVPGWNELPFSTPYTATANTTYYAGVFNKGNIYGYISHEFDTALSAPSGAAGLTFVAGNSTHQNGAFVYSGPGGVPASSFGNTWYGVDVAMSTPGAGPTVISSTDAESVSDTSSLANSNASVDAGGLTDTSTVNTATLISTSDGSGVSDASSSAELLVSVDNSNVSDTDISQQTIGSTDSSAVGDLSAVALVVTSTDSVSSTETSDITISDAVSEGTVSDSSGLVVVIPSGDSGTATEVSSVSQAQSSTDSVFLNETDTTTAAIVTNSTSVVSEQPSTLATATTDAAVATDVTLSISATTATVDAGSLTDLSAAGQQLQTGDALTVTDAISYATTSTSADTAVALDDSSLNTGSSVTASDSLFDADIAGLTNTSTSVDSGLAVDNAVVNQSQTVVTTDAASVIEQLSLLSAAFASADVAAGTETTAVTSQLSLFDIGALTDSSAVTVAAVTVFTVDAGTLDNIASVLTNTSVSDTGTVAEVVTASAPISANDALGLVDILVGTTDTAGVDTGLAVDASSNQVVLPVGDVWSVDDVSALFGSATVSAADGSAGTEWTTVLQALDISDSTVLDESVDRTTVMLSIDASGAVEAAIIVQHAGPEYRDIRVTVILGNGSSTQTNLVGAGWADRFTIRREPGR